MPRTFQACEALWTPRDEKKGYKTVAPNTELFRWADHFDLQFHRHDIVKYYPDYLTVETSWGGSVTTIGRLNAFTRGRFCKNASLGYDEDVRVNGLPFFNGIRLLPNGDVHPEDYRSDFYKRPKKEATKEYVALFAWVKKSLRLRFELGEFKEGAEFYRPHLARDLMALKQSGEFIPRAIGSQVFQRGAGIRDFEDHINEARKYCRDNFLKLVDGIETVQVKNVQHF
jgi:hypothetical protein